MTGDPGDEIRRRLRELEEAGRRGAEQGLFLASEHLLKESREQVPHEEATLERSGKATQDGLTAAVSFNTPYAVVQHEDLTLAHDAGRNAKYLEKPMNSERTTFGQIIATSVRREIGA
jgi:hypothetical protein